MHSSFTGLGIGLVMAIVLIYLLLVVNFQSWLDPFIIITALPGALAGVVWALAPDAHHRQRAGPDGGHHEPGRGHGQFRAGGHVRAERSAAGPGPAGGGLGSRRQPLAAGADDRGGHGHRHVADGPGLGEGGEQNAPLGRAVIGGLVVATIATLFFVPVVFSLLHRRATAPVEDTFRFRASSWRHQPCRCRRLSLTMNHLWNNRTDTDATLPGQPWRQLRKPPRAPAPNCATPPSWLPCSSSSARWRAWCPAGCIAMRCAPKRGNSPFKPSAWCRPPRAKPPPG